MFQFKNLKYFPKENIIVCFQDYFMLTNVLSALPKFTLEAYEKPIFPNMGLF